MRLGCVVRANGLKVFLEQNIYYKQNSANTNILNINCVAKWAMNFDLKTIKFHTNIYITKLLPLTISFIWNRRVNSWNSSQLWHFPANMKPLLQILLINLKFIILFIWVTKHHKCLAFLNWNHRCQSIEIQTIELIIVM